MKGRGIVAVCVLLALILPGCGDDAATGETDGGALTKAEFVRQAAAVCEKAKNEIINKSLVLNRKFAEGSKPREKAEFKLVEVTIVPSLEHEVEQLKALGTPPANAAQIEQMLKLIEGAIAEGRTEPETYVSGPDYRWGNEHFGKAHRLALAYGIDNCPVS